MSPPVKHFYCHVPFCPRKCSYCAFVTHIGSLALVPAYLEALEAEFDRLAAKRPGGPLSTVYFGGGTPSMLTPADIRRLLDSLDAHLGIENGAEITVEAHPETVDEAKLAGFLEAGVTRLSMGAESLESGELLAIGRSHASERVADVVRWARAAGFAQLGLDLIYGLPTQTCDSWERTLSAALDFRPEHLSLYPLSIEPRTVFARRQREGKLSVPTDDVVADMYCLACGMLADAGYEHYEVANWSLPGHACRHNLAYWHNREFYGAGVGAHGYLHPHRYENMRQTRGYIERMRRGDDPVVHVEEIDEPTRKAETVMLRLRLLREGLDLSAAHGDGAVDALRNRRELVDRLAAQGLVRVVDRRLLIEERAALVAHEAIAELM